MLDNLRNHTDPDSFFTEDESAMDAESASSGSGGRRSFDQVTGTTPQQRFALALMLLVMVGLLGFLLLVMAGKMVPSFLF
jgi:hypothetical protein